MTMNNDNLLNKKNNDKARNVGKGYKKWLLKV